MNKKRYPFILLVLIVGFFVLTALSRSVTSAMTPGSQTQQTMVALTALQLDGSYEGVAGIEYTFTAVAAPANATTPITYVWQAGTETVTHIGGVTDTFSVAWQELGKQSLSVTASNGAGNVSQNRSLTIMPNTERIPAIYGGPAKIYPIQAQALIKTANPGVMGPNSCTSFGDPYSPYNSPWEPGPFTYEYLIQIPGDYPFAEVRVELFDPDSINQAENDVTLARTNAAIAEGLAATMTATCDSDQRNPCQIETGERELVIDSVLDYEQINPAWLMRIDENRSGINGTNCGTPANYDAAYNTRALFQLSYFLQNVDEAPYKVPLAFYMGQVGDGVRDSGDHLTDLYWVAPGAPSSYDQLASVPVDPGSAASFQINLATDVPNILTDPQTGDRYLSLEITSIDGASENGFDIWAGPPNYINSVPSEANARNLYLLNNPQAHNAYGVTVYANGIRSQNWHLAGQTAVFPFIYLSADAAGQDLSLSLFDSDSGSQPPITFFADSIARSEWSQSFSVPGQTDPDGQTGRCIPGTCNNRWVDPPYRVTLPEDFAGGRLMVDYNSGSFDNTTWQIRGAGQLFVEGPNNGETNETYSFTADAIFFLGADVITYTWEIEGQEPINVVGDLSSTVAVSWPSAGTKMMTVTAVSNADFIPPWVRSIVGYHQIEIEEPIAPTPTPTGNASLRLKVMSRPSDIFVGWLPNRFLTAESYRLLRAEAGGLFQELTVTTSTQYVDHDPDLVAGSSYCYQVEALDGNMHVIVASAIRCTDFAP